jgi:hypothetical protein
MPYTIVQLNLNRFLFSNPFALKKKFARQLFMKNNFFSFLLAECSTNNAENNSPSLTPPPSAPSKSPQTHPAYMSQKDMQESDDEHEIIEEDDEDSTEGRNNDNASPNSQNKRKKKTRTVFSRAQVFQLESTFDLKR